MVAVLSSRFQVWTLSSPGMRDDPGRKPAELRSAGRPRAAVPTWFLLLADHSQAHALQLPRVEPRHLLSKPSLGAIELVLLGGRCEIARSEQVGYRGLAEPAEPV